MPKDRTRRRFLASDVQIVIERSSAHPVEYAIVLTHGPINDVMHDAELKLLGDWRDIVHDWEHVQ